jgi:hypothetical protein
VLAWDTNLFARPVGIMPVNLGQGLGIH